MFAGFSAFMLSKMGLYYYFYRPATKKRLHMNSPFCFISSFIWTKDPTGYTLLLCSHYTRN